MAGADEAPVAASLLLSLPPHLLLSVASRAAAADRARLRRTCQALKRAVDASVRRGARLTLRDGGGGGGGDSSSSDGGDCEWSGCWRGARLLAALPRPRCLELVLRRGDGLDDDLAAALLAGHARQLSALAELRVREPAGGGGGSCLEEGQATAALALLLAGCPALTALHLAGGVPSGPAEQPAACWARRPAGLRRLALTHGGGLSPAGLAAWLAAPGEASSGTAAAAAPLHTQLLRMAEAAGEDLGMLAGPPAWPELLELDLSGCRRLGGSWGFLALCPRLRRLSLHSCPMVCNGTLEALAGAATAATAAAAAAAEGEGVLQHGLELQHVDLSYTRVRDAGMRWLAAALPRLRHLGVKGANVGDDGLAHLHGLPLTALHIKHCHRVTEEGVQQLSALAELQELSFGYTSMPGADEAAEAIALLRELTALDLLSSELTDRGLAALGSLRCLRRLRLYQAGVSCEGLREFARCPAGSGLEELVLYGLGMLTSLECLGAFPALRDLQLGGLCDLEDVPAAMRQLGALRRLRRLTLERIDGVSTEGLEAVMTGCRELEALRVRGCDGICEEDAERLAAGGAARCRSSACVWWAPSPSCDTDDEEDGWELMPP